MVRTQLRTGEPSRSGHSPPCGVRWAAVAGTQARGVPHAGTAGKSEKPNIANVGSSADRGGRLDSAGGDVGRCRPPAVARRFLREETQRPAAGLRPATRTPRSHANRAGGECEAARARLAQGQDGPRAPGGSGRTPQPGGRRRLPATRTPRRGCDARSAPAPGPGPARLGRVRRAGIWAPYLQPRPAQWPAGGRGAGVRGRTRGQPRSAAAGGGGDASRPQAPEKPGRGLQRGCAPKTARRVRTSRDRWQRLPLRAAQAETSRGRGKRARGPCSRRGRPLGVQGRRAVLTLHVQGDR